MPGSDGEILRRIEKGRFVGFGVLARISDAPSAATGCSPSALRSSPDIPGTGCSHTARRKIRATPCVNMSSRRLATKAYEKRGLGGDRVLEIAGGELRADRVIRPRWAGLPRAGRAQREDRSQATSDKPPRSPFHLQRSAVFPRKASIHRNLATNPPLHPHSFA